MSIKLRATEGVSTKEVVFEGTEESRMKLGQSGGLILCLRD